ncbi:hypothetical protein A4A49_11046 [Nicotiana attenuata]|uniref:Uncharacterized protein n=2 Tax=Nicotiana attenuata TaxID=49451 RepID=A0A1J6ITC8_NICAT|nr:hypothetical protein A4A49_11046 [Nicotiana attenuata]
MQKDDSWGITITLIGYYKILDKMHRARAGADGNFVVRWKDLVARMFLARLTFLEFVSYDCLSSVAPVIIFRFQLWKTACNVETNMVLVMWKGRSASMLG